MISQRSCVSCGITLLAVLLAVAAGCRDQSPTGTSSAAVVPSPSDSGPWSRLATGVDHTCGVTASGGFYCWGQNWFGQFGVATPTQSATPTAGVLGFQPSSFGTGYDFTCGLTPVGAAFCWGCNQTGALGNGAWDPNVLNIIPHPIPLPVSGNLTFASVAVGWWHVCGLTPAGAAYCWGDDSEGELGNGFTARLRYTPEPVVGNLTFASISAGQFSTCGVTPTPAGQAYCWGQGGLVGDGTSIRRVAPAAVAGGLSFVAITVGGTHTCALTEAGLAYCWGLNASGELGDGTTDQRYAPVPVIGDVRFASLSAAYDHTCGLTATGAAYCWGNNDTGELGVGDSLPHWEPTAVPGKLRFAGLTSSYRTCGWSPGGAAFCWQAGAPVRLSDP